MEVKKIIEKIKKVYPMSDFSIVEMCRHFKEHQLPKHFHLTQPGVKDNHVYFIERGCSRSYLLAEGKELTNWFSMDGDMTFSSNSLYHGKPGFEYVQLKIIHLSFLGASSPSTSFLNSSFGAWIEEMGLDRFLDLVKPSEVTHTQASMLKLYIHGFRSEAQA